MRHKLCIALALISLSACADYQFSVNDRVLYTPAPLFTEYNIPDPALRACVKQHIGDGSVTAASQLSLLNCSHAGVADLSGLEIFTGISHLKLSSNAITDLAPLATLAALSELYLDGNKVRSIMPLRGLEQLSLLSLGGNATIPCLQLTYFRELPNLTLEPPQHCAG